MKEKNLDAPSAAPARRKYWPDQTAGADVSTPADSSEPAVSSAPETTATIVPEPVSSAASTEPAASPRPRTSRRTSSDATPAPALPLVTSEPELTPEVENRAVGKKRGPKPSAEPLERSTLKLRKVVLENLDAMLEDAPRHVKKQDLVDHIFTDFFNRNPSLPESLRKKPSKD